MGAAWLIAWAGILGSMDGPFPNSPHGAQRIEEEDLEEDPAARAEWDDVRAGENRATAAVLWSLLPGGGQFYLGNTGAGLAYSGSFLGGIALAAASREPGAALGAGIVLQNIYFYSIYDSYRDARLEINNRGYRRPVSEKSFWSNLADPYRRRNLTHERMWTVPLLLASDVGLLMLLRSREDLSTEFEDEDLSGMSMKDKAGVALLLGAGAYVLLTPVAVGEEALFRGAIQGALREHMPAPVALGGTSAIFGAVHIPNVTGGAFGTYTSGDQALLISVRFLSAFFGGLSFGWIFEGAHRADLGPSIAAHTLSNALVFASMPFLAKEIRVPPMTFRFTW